MRDDVEPVVTEEDIAYVVSRMTGIPTEDRRRSQ
jgi:ATP-dependent Clp protease ATP-binding subunit ClpA